MNKTTKERASGDILVIYRKQLGDLLLLQPALEYLSAQFGAPIKVRTRTSFGDLLQLMPGNISMASFNDMRISRVYCFDSKASTLRDALASWPAKRTLVLTRPKKHTWWHTLFFSEILTTSTGEDYRARLILRTLGGKYFDPPRLHTPPNAWLPAGLAPDYLLVHPTSAWRRKTWPEANWVALLNELQNQFPMPLVITSGSEDWEREMAEVIATGVTGRTFNLAGQTSLRNYLAVLSRAKAVLTVDGSASHLASAFGRPTLTLFGPTNQVHWHYPVPLSKSLSATDFSTERKPPVAAIPVAAALAAARQLIERQLND